MKREGILQLLILLLLVVSQSNFANTHWPFPPDEICDNGIDDDLDGLVDCYDPDCCNNSACQAVYFDPCSLVCVAPDDEQTLTVRLEWASTGNNWHPYNTPIVGDLDGDGAVEVIGNRGTWQGIIDYKNLLVIDGFTGMTEKVINTPWFRHTGKELCMADVDRNGRADLFFQIDNSSFNDPATYKHLLCYEFDGVDYQQKWQSDQPASNGIPSLADFNQDQIPELYIGAHIFNSLTGELLVRGDMESNFGLGFAVAADVLPDNACSHCSGLELIVGNEVYAVRLNPDDPNENALIRERRIFGNNIFDGFTSLSDMDGDGDLDAVVSSPDGQSQATIYIWDIQQAQILGRYTFPATTNGWASLPCIRDIDGDQIPEIVVSSNGTLRLLEFRENTLSERWQIETEDWSSRSGATIFDLNGDGRFEILHRDQLAFRILNAEDGTALFIDQCRSTNLYEHPVVVDVDQDGEAEILCSCENELRSYGSANAAWVSTRNIWNQYNYFYTNINDDLSIPIAQQATLLPETGNLLNSYLNQYSNENNIAYVEVQLPPSLVIEQGQSIDLMPQTIANTPLNYTWSPPEGLSCTTCETPSAQPATDQFYALTVTDDNGCSDSTSISISVLACGNADFGIPSAFTPDYDGINDYFQVFLNTELDIEGDIGVFNRWGQQVFSSSDLNGRWDGQINGRPAASDVYLYQVTYRCADGITQTLKGDVTLIR
ncbi:MAG: FG-GAP-like repeat-containing protein [Bacteroidota bacterium]